MNCRHESHEEVTVADILAELTSNRNAVCNGVTKFNVCRSQVWDGARRAILHRSFVPENTMSVKFTDDIGTTEGAVDEGGPRRELLQLLMEHLMYSSRVFEGPECSKHLTFIHDG